MKQKEDAGRRCSMRQILLRYHKILLPFIKIIEKSRKGKNKITIFLRVYQIHILGGLFAAKLQCRESVLLLVRFTKKAGASPLS